MGDLNSLKLTYIPYTYWKEETCQFKIISGSEKPPQDTDFFFLWTSSKESERYLSSLISQAFTSIPTVKLISGQIFLAFPEDKSKNFKLSMTKGKIIPILPMARTLYTFDLKDVKDEETQLSNSIKTWVYLTKLLFEILNKGQFIPQLEVYDKEYHKASWKLLIKSKSDKNRFKAITESSSWTSHCLATSFVRSNLDLRSEGIWHPSFLYSLFLDNVGDKIIRSILNQKDFRAFKEFYSSEIEKEGNLDFKFSWDYKFLKSLINKNPFYPIEGFHETILPNLIREWTQSVQVFPFELNFVINIEIKYPKKGEEEWPLVLFLSIGSNNFPINELWQKEGPFWKELNISEESSTQYLEYILRALGRAAKIYPPIKRILQDMQLYETILTVGEVIDFLKYPKSLLVQSGYNVILPAVFSDEGTQRLTNKLVIRSKFNKDKQKGVYSVLPSLFDVNSMVEIKWDIKVGNNQLDEKEKGQLINSEEPLVNINGDWIFIEQQDLEELKNIKTPEIDSYMDVLRFGMVGKIELEEEGAEYEVIVEGYLDQIISNLRSIDKFNEIGTPKSFQGELRPYQQEALSWIANMAKFNFGLCLADDMGLGKTIQIISFLCYLKENFPKNPGSYLIICPTSILFNWQRELDKFAPSLDITLHHGADRIRDLSKIREFAKAHHVYLTSYGTIRNDIEYLEPVQFSGVIIDESQNIKNYDSQQSQAIRKLQSQFKICLSGTPIENRLLELWSLFDFLNPGLLGERNNFQKDFVLPIEKFQDQEIIEKLKIIINPFVMRRVKSDKSIIKDLPEKNEMKIFVELTEEQMILYENLVNDTLNQIQSSTDNRKHKGLILALLVKLKQICNHPHQFLKKKIDSNDLETNLHEIVSKSQKLMRLSEMVEEIMSNKEKVLIFTQFTQMGEILQKVLEYKFNTRVLYFHGGIPEKGRKKIVDEFQSTSSNSPRILILSLRAGGTGLNLTQGTTVIHFDRWWNPAVEDQATDRAYRIGQKSVVNVYKFISRGTIEEKIDFLLEEKKDLADMIVTTTGESWISDLDGEKLQELLILSK